MLLIVTSQLAHDVVLTSVRRFFNVMDVETMSCAYWVRSIDFIEKPGFIYCVHLDVFCTFKRCFLWINCLLLLLL